MKNRVDAAKSGSMPLLRRDGSGRKAGPVEAVVAWAWREELPKVPRRQAGPLPMAGGWDKTGRFAEMLSLVDQFGVNQYGAVPDFSADSWPCADAQAIGNAVMALDDCALELPDDWRPAPELDRFGGLGAKAVSEAWRRMTYDEGTGLVKLRLKPSELIIRRAVLGYDVEAMKLDETQECFEAYGNGQEKWFVAKTMDIIVGTNPDGGDRTEPHLVELNGWNSKSRRPLPDAYRRPYLDPDPVNAIIARAEHEIWLSALAVIFDMVASEMEDVRMLPCAVPAQPWLGEGRQARVLPDLVGDAALEREQQDKADAAMRARFPRWFRLFEKKLEAPA